MLAQALFAQNRTDDARREIAHALLVLADSRRAIARLPETIVALRLEALTDAASAARALEALRDDARERGLLRFAVEAHRAIVEIEEAASPGAGAAAREALRADALASGFPLYAR